MNSSRNRFCQLGALMASPNFQPEVGFAPPISALLIELLLGARFRRWHPPGLTQAPYQPACRQLLDKVVLVVFCSFEDL